MTTDNDDNMPDTPITKIETSNSLADLAARIRSEHKASLIAIKRGLRHAISAGTLLIEAKAQLPHGQWLIWLRDHCQLPDRTARDYMHLARYAAGPQGAKSAVSADMTGALELLAPPEAPEANFDWDDLDFAAWAKYRLEGPFSSFDFGPDRYDWVQVKLMHMAKLPWVVTYCFDVMEDDLPTLRLCSFEDLLEAAKALAPNAGDKRALPFDSESFDNMASMQGAIVEIKLRAMWVLGRLLHEIEDRETLSDKRYDAEWNETHQKLMARLDQKLADLKQKRVGRATVTRPSPRKASMPGCDL